MTRRFVALVAMLLACSTPLLAHEGKPHAGKHGGKVVDAGHHHMEIVAKDGTIEVYLEHDDGNAEDVKEAKATATVLSGGKKAVIALTPEAGNFLKGNGAFTAGKGTTIVITLTVPGHKPEQARLTLD